METSEGAETVGDMWRKVWAYAPSEEMATADLVARLGAGLRHQAYSVVMVWVVGHGHDLAEVGTGLREQVLGELIVCRVERPLGAPKAAVTGAFVVGFFSAWASFGLGLAQLNTGALQASRSALQAAATQLGVAPAALDPTRHVALTLFDGSSGFGESFCLGASLGAPQVGWVGGAFGSDASTAPAMWFRGAWQHPAALVILLAPRTRFALVRSCHVTPTAQRMVITACAGRRVTELDGYPAAHRYAQALANTCGTTRTDVRCPLGWEVGGRLTVRSVRRVVGDTLELAGGVLRGQVVTLLMPGDLLSATRGDLAHADRAVGGVVGTLGFSCVERHNEARAQGLVAGLRDVYAEFRCVGFESLGEQSGRFLVNHMLMGVAFGGEVHGR